MICALLSTYLAPGSQGPLETVPAWQSERISYNQNTPTHGRQGGSGSSGAHGTAKVAELVDALDLESSGETRESSSLSFRTSSSCASPKRTLAAARSCGAEELIDGSLCV